MQLLLIFIAVYLKHRSQIQYQNNINLDMFEILITHCIVKVFLFIEMRKKNYFYLFAVIVLGIQSKCPSILLSKHSWRSIFQNKAIHSKNSCHLFQTMTEFTTKYYS